MIHLLLPNLKEGGVYDYASRLQEEIGMDDVCLVHLSKKSIVNWKISQDDSVILQMSGYGFDSRGAPLWLLHELERRRKLIKTLGIYFHELYAFGPPWSSSFWLNPVQRHITRRMAILSDFWMTSREGSAQWLRNVAGDKPHAVMPIFSNIGETEEVAQIRQPKIIVFGSAGLRQATYKAAGDNLFEWAKQASLEVHDIGAPVSDVRLLEVLNRNGVVQHGRLEVQAVRRVMQDARYGVLTYPVEYVAKSGVFAANCAHGICPVLISNGYAQVDGLEARVHYLPGVPDVELMAMAQDIGRKAWEWYQPHNVAKHVTILNSLVKLAKKI